MLVAPCDVPSAPGITGADSYAFGVDSTNVRDSTGATIDNGRAGVTTARSPMLAADNMTKGRCGNVTGRATGR
jgi:hypothetical protein